jgi:hypothetical protein
MYRDVRMPRQAQCRERPSDFVPFEAAEKVYRIRMGNFPAAYSPYAITTIDHA